MRKFYRFAIAAAAGLLAFVGSASLALAQTATASTSIDFSSIVASVENVVFGVAAAAFAWLGHRAVTVIENWTGTQLTALHGSLLDDAITEALGLARNKLDASLAGKETVDVHNQLAATAAQLVVTKIPDTLSYLGISQAAVIDKIKGLLGISLSPIQTVTTAAATAPSAADLAKELMNALTGQLQSTAPSDGLQPNHTAAVPAAA